MRRGALAVAALAVAVGCDRGPAKAIVDDMPAGEVRLIGAGAEPKVKLRYEVPKGTRVALDMTMRVSMAVSGEQMPQLPVMRMTMEEECLDVEPSGAMRFEVRVASLTSNGEGQMAMAMTMITDMMENMVYRFRLSPTGIVDGVVVEGLTGPMAELGTQMKDSVEQFAAPLPEEPVGKGATWKFKRTGKAEGVDVATINQYELIDVADSRATFTVDGRVVAPRQKIDRMGATVELVKMDGTVSGRFTNDLRRFAPTGTFGVSMDMAVAVPGKTVKMHVTLDSELTAQ